MKLKGTSSHHAAQAGLKFQNRIPKMTESFQEELSMAIVTPGLCLCPRRPQPSSEVSDSENQPDHQ